MDIGRDEINCVSNFECWEITAKINLYSKGVILACTDGRFCYTVHHVVCLAAGALIGKIKVNPRPQLGHAERKPPPQEANADDVPRGISVAPWEGNSPFGEGPKEDFGQNLSGKITVRCDAHLIRLELSGPMGVFLA